MILTSCAGNIPKPSKKVKVYNGAPEFGAICRLEGSKVTEEAQIPRQITEAFIAPIPAKYECIDPRAEVFKQYACLSFEDLASLYSYSELLIKSCQKWR